MLEPQFDSLNTARKGASKSCIFGVPKVGSRKRNASEMRNQTGTRLGEFYLLLLVPIHQTLALRRPRSNLVSLGILILQSSSAPWRFFRFSKLKK